MEIEKFNLYQWEKNLAQWEKDYLFAKDGYANDPHIHIDPVREDHAIKIRDFEKKLRNQYYSLSSKLQKSEKEILKFKNYISNGGANNRISLKLNAEIEVYNSILKIHLDIEDIFEKYSLKFS